MASAGKKKTTMAKISRESRLRERRQDKEARKRARRDAAANPPSDHDDGLLAGEVDSDAVQDDGIQGGRVEGDPVS
jgi:hypothetical protein